MSNNTVKFIYNKKKKAETKFNPEKIFNLTKEEFIKKNPTHGTSTIDNVIQVNMEKIVKCIDLNEELQKILLFGEVQSGKTNNMIFLTSVLRDMGFNKFIILTGTKNNLNIQNVKRFKEANKECDFLDFREEKNFFRDSSETQFLYGIKQNISKLLKNFQELSATDFEDWKIAIIDDESDEASSEKNKQNRTINSNIENLLKYKTKNKIYFSVTATPYANLISYTDFLIPNYLVPLSSAKAYCGLKEFKDQKRYFVLNEDIIRSLKEVDVYDKNLKEFLENSIMEFLLKCFRYSKNFQYLINIDTGTNTIKGLESFFRLIVNKLKVKNDEFLLNFVGREEIKEFRICINNLKVKYTMEGIDYIRENVPEIIIGGNLLSRGVTFDDLLFQIMINHGSSKNLSSDTLLQRARWFGYRKAYINDMKIYVSNVASNFYEEIYYVENSIREMYSESFEHSTIKKERIENLFKEHCLKWTS
ncbi:endonuclease [Spiroplasma gladiatoris]|uniref:Endonuclease n=1 Tax=Spiroplasma gladiatoris TaxID=2143 RepID=A0A4P7AJT4_9MOLU|nr:Z1 domain-containing protein [Spiroplasma gladiatoris]QBQ07810.1 endonuclease [Spiroplasma gladiatoris]